MYPLLPLSVECTAAGSENSTIVPNTHTDTRPLEARIAADQYQLSSVSFQLHHHDTYHDQINAASHIIIALHASKQFT